MQSHPFRSVVVLALLLGGLFLIHISSQLDSSNAPVEPGFTYVADVDYWQRTDREQLVKTAFSFDLAHDLSALPLELGEWQGQDVPETNREVFILLEPEQFIQRVYEKKSGQYLWLTLIGSRKTRSFHAPDLCYEAGGWQTALSSQAIALNNGDEINGLWLEARRQNAPDVEDLTFYFYLFPTRERDQTEGIILLRITSPRYGTVEETVTLQGDFLRQLFNGATLTKGTL